MNSMADNQKVYEAIKTIADELCKENKTYLRADLAFELKKYGIASDSSEVSKLVFDAYRYFHDNGNIAIAFVSNNSRTTLVAEYKLNDSLEQGNKEEALKIAETELALSSSALEQLKEQVEQNLNLVLVKGTSKMADIVMGTNGVKDVRSKCPPVHRAVLQGLPRVQRRGLQKPNPRPRCQGRGRYGHPQL